MDWTAFERQNAVSLSFEVPPREFLGAHLLSIYRKNRAVLAGWKVRSFERDHRHARVSEDLRRRRF
jgi:hypothetical protein